MAVNSAFKTSGKAATTAEQNLYASLVKEAIQIHGHDVNYIDRTLTARDNIFGEDSLSQFNNIKTLSPSNPLWLIELHQYCSVFQS